MAADMALQVVVSPFLGVLFDNLSNLISNEVAQIWGVDKEMRKLASTLTAIQAVLADAEERQLTSKAVADWLAKLRALAYDADDVLDEWAMEADQVTSSKQVCASIFSCFCSERICFRRRIAKRVHELEQKFDCIASERSKLELREGPVERRIEHYQNRETSSFPSDPIVYGRDEEKEYVVGLLLSNADNPEVSVCSIVGMGGLGKTTLAQLCYNEPRVKNHFDVRIWVCVSDDFDVKRLTKEIIVSVSEEACNIDQLDTLQRCLQEKLAHKRFLLVLDDVWDDNQEQWSRLESPLRCGAAGSAIMVTTRLKRVAEIIGTRPPCFLKVLSEDDCWRLFQQRAFGIQNEASPNLVEIGHAIVKKCGGVPLAAKVLGGLMRLKREENEWLFVRDSNIWDLGESSENTILPALRLSYTHLAPELKQCFTFCSIYPKGHEMGKEEVVRLWMANNFIQPKEGMQLEDIANQIFGELCWRSFFEEEERKEFLVYGSWRVTLVYKMHDLIRDLACSISGNECCYMDPGSQITNIPSNTRQKLALSILQTPHESGTRLRTLVIKSRNPNSPGVMFPNELPLSLSCFISLRALSLGEGYVLGPKLIESIVHLKHLRYLRLSENEFESLPEALCKLKHLETLELVNCRDLKKLPNRMRDMSCLRHLDIKGCGSLREMPIELGRLTSLRTLSIFIVGPDYGQGIDQLHGLDFLSGELEIKGLEHVQSLEDAKKANMRRKKNLTSLKLSWSDSADTDCQNPKDVIEGLLPHANIRELSIHGYRGQKIIFGHELPSLEYLELSHMPKLEKWFSGNSEGVIQFPRLMKLEISKCPELKSLPTSSLSLLIFLLLKACNPLILVSLGNLPRLYLLTISQFTHFPEEILQHAPSLTYLHFWKCAVVQSLPKVGSSSLKHLQISDCPHLTNVSHVLRGQTALQGFRISYCPKAEISAVEYHHLKSLQLLYIEDIPDLESLPDGLRYVSSNLRELRIRKWFSLISLPNWIETFTNLVSLQLSDCNDLKDLPDGIQHLINLRSFAIRGCKNLKSLPNGLQHLINLRSFEIWGCKNLKSLPNGLQHLTNLKILSIRSCHPELHGRCNKESGEHWPMIAHIPDICNSLE